MNRSGKTWVWIVVLCVVAPLLLVGSCIAWLLEEPENVDITVEAPLTVMKGEPFVIDIQVTNTSEEPQLLHSVDVYDAYLKGIAIEHTEPKYLQAFHVPIDNTQSYEFKQEIPPGGTVTVRFHAVGVKPGDYSAYVDVCINTGTNFLTYPLRTVVEESL